MYAWGKANGFDTTTKKWKTDDERGDNVPAYDMSNVVINIPIKDPSRVTKDALLIDKVRSSFGDDMAEVVEYYLKNSLKNPDKYLIMPNEEKHGKYTITSSNEQVSKEFKCTILQFEFRKI